MARLEGGFDLSIGTHSAPASPGVAEQPPNRTEPDAAPRALRRDLSGKEPELVVPELVEYAAQLRASDLFFDTAENEIRVSARHFGIVRSIGELTADIGRRCISYLKNMADMNISEHRRPMEGRWLFTRPSGERIDLRVSSIPTLFGEDCTVRVLDRAQRLLPLGQLGFPAEAYNLLVTLLNSPSGLIVVTGPTETGKSTTLYACLSYLNNGERRIHTIEEPVEYFLDGIRQSQVNPSIGVTFDELLRHVLRQAPHVIMVGEIRDAVTAQTATRAAGSGLLVLSTLHAPVATAAVHTLLRLDIQPHLLSHALRAVVSQRLLRTLCPRCKVAFDRPSEHLFDEVRPWLKPGEGERMYGPRGCTDCHMTGYSGMSAIFEMFQVSPAISQLIDERAPQAAIRSKAIEEGMTEFRQSAFLKVAQGETTIEEVLRVLPAECLS
jgi:type II secretory ATPase GspE/PulE/Tfp pilus assembly ATPase PilB-like protein